jgi:hypothetical protein
MTSALGVRGVKTPDREPSGFHSIVFHSFLSFLAK